MSKPQKTAKYIVAARSINYFGSAFSDFILPLYIYEITKSSTLLGLQWAINAIVKLLAGKYSSKLQIWKTNIKGIVSLDILQGLAALIPLILINQVGLSIFISGILLSFFVTLQSGYIDGLIKETGENKENPEFDLKTWLNSKNEIGKNLGQFIGYLSAWLLATYLSFNTAVLIDSITFFISAAIMSKIVSKIQHETSKSISSSYSLLFKKIDLRYLTLSQALLSFSIFIYNAAFIYTMKHSFNAPNSAIAILLISQSFSYLIGNNFSSKFGKISLKKHFIFRSFFIFVFIGFSMSNSYYLFIFWNCILSALIGFTQPGIISIFQSFATKENARVMGSTRASVMAISGSLGAASTGLLFNYFPHSIVFSVGGVTAFLGVFFFYKFYSETESTK